MIIEKWSEVDNDIKEKLHTATKKLFMCDEDKREYVLKDCMTKWKIFKTRLTKEYFTKKTKNETSNPPWATYVGIEKEDWEIFKAKRLDKDFKSLSDRNRANQQQNEHPHRLGRGGYMKRDEQHIKDHLCFLLVF